MIVKVNQDNIIDAAYIHAESWKESHRRFCNKEYVELHTVKRQRAYLESEIQKGKQLYMLIKDVPVGIVSVKENFYTKHGFNRTGKEKKLSDKLSEVEMRK